MGLVGASACVSVEHRDNCGLCYVIQFVFPQGAETMIGYFSIFIHVGVNFKCDWPPCYPNMVNNFTPNLSTGLNLIVSFLLLH